MKTKKSQLVELIEKGQLNKAVLFAAKFQNLGDHDKQIRQAAGAITNPRFYEQIHGDIKLLIKTGHEAVIDKYM